MSRILPGPVELTVSFIIKVKVTNVPRASLRGQPEAARRRAGSALERAMWLRAPLGEARGAAPRQGTPQAGGM